MPRGAEYDYRQLHALGATATIDDGEIIILEPLDFWAGPYPHRYPKFLIITFCPSLSLPGINSGVPEHTKYVMHIT